MSISSVELFDTRYHWRWLYIPKPVARPTYRLYCFPFAGGSNTTYKEWLEYLPVDIELRTISLPGRGARAAEPFSRDLVGMSHQIADAIRALENGPYVFFGHSMGAILAHEVTCRLREKGSRLPVHLFVSGRQAPQVPDTYRLPVALMSDEVFESQVRLLNGIPKEISSWPFMMEYFLPIIKADFIAIDQWICTHKQPLPLPISVFIGKDDPTTNYRTVVEWRKHTKTDFYLRTFPGDHFFVKTYERAVVETLNQTLSMF